MPQRRLRNCHAERYSAKHLAWNFEARSFASTLRMTISGFFSVFCSLCLCVSNRCTHLRVAHVLFCLLAIAGVVRAESIENSLGWKVSVDEEGGYTISAKEPGWV